MLSLLFILTLKVGASWREFQLQPDDVIFIRAANIQLKVSTSQDAKILKFNGEESGWSIQRQGRLLVFQGEDAGSISSVADLTKSAKKQSLEIFAPSLPIEVYARTGAITLGAGGQHDVKVQLVQGTVVSNQRSGLLKIVGVRGDQQISEHRGKIEIEMHTAKTSIQKSKGDFKVDLQLGNALFEGNVGPLALVAGNSQNKVVSHEGNLQVDQLKGQLQVLKAAGRQDLKLDEVQTQLDLLPDSTVMINDTKSRIQLGLPASSGAKLNIKNQFGDIVVPGELKVYRQNESKFVNGSLRGESKNIHLTIRSEQGKILVK